MIPTLKSLSLRFLILGIGYQRELEQRTAELEDVSEKLVALTQEYQQLSRKASQTEKDREEAAAQAVQYSDALGRFIMLFIAKHLSVRIEVPRCV
jgi:uncharacterized protein YoxC